MHDFLCYLANAKFSKLERNNVSSLKVKIIAKKCSNNNKKYRLGIDKQVKHPYHLLGS